MEYTNPILYGDYSDPDVIRVGEWFYMISSSFTYIPGITVLRSGDLVRWELIGYAARHLPFERYDRPAHRCGTWAPSLRWHNGRFLVYVCLPDEGLLVFSAEDPAGEWACHYVHDVCGWIDPCPLFEEDGSAWLVHAFAASRCGINNILDLHRLSPDGLRVLDKGRLVYSGAEHGDITVEGPKIYRRGGLYWILCPAGGVRTGYQLALRSERIEGPYERRVVLAQGGSPVNGPHQGGWVEDGRGGDWFVHFQDVGAYGRVPHLQPVRWDDGWPVMGCGGVPVPGGDTGLTGPDVRIPASDDFADGPGLQWQWQANPNPAWYTALRPGLRLHAAPAETLRSAGQFLSQLMQARDFDLDTQLCLHGTDGDCAGLGVMGFPWHTAALERGRVVLRRGEAQELNRRTPARERETELAAAPWESDRIALRLRVRDGMDGFFVGEAPEHRPPLGGAVPLAPAGWTGARPGIFCMNRLGAWGGWADFSHVRIG